MIHARQGLRGLLLPIALLAVAAAGCQTTVEQAPAQQTDWFDGGPMQPATAETLQLTARVLAAKGRMEQAGFVLDRMYSQYPEFLGTYTEGAEVLLLQGRVKDATGWLDRGLQRFPSQPILLNNRGLCHLLAADLPLATADFEAAYAADPGDADFVANLALVRALSGNDMEAARLWNTVLPPEAVGENLNIAKQARPRFKSAKP